MSGTAINVLYFAQVAELVGRSADEIRELMDRDEFTPEVIKMGDRLVPVDAQFPLEACQRMLVATDGAATITCPPDSSRGPSC